MRRSRRLDIDVPVPELAAEIETLAISMLGPTSLRRIGQAPKSLLAYRTIAPVAKMATPELFLPDGTKLQVEILGAGQQFVAYGEHPDTGHEYVWPETGPDVVARADLPVANEEDCAPSWRPLKPCCAKPAVKPRQSARQPQGRPHGQAC